jgi:hypothetical protein
MASRPSSAAPGDPLDENKLKVLKDLGYVVRATCGLCQYGRFAAGGQDFGTCKIRFYSHGKHSDAHRELSINRAGTCPAFRLKPGHNLGAYQQFLEQP